MLMFHIILTTEEKVVLHNLNNRNWTK